MRVSLKVWLHDFMCSECQEQVSQDVMDVEGGVCPCGGTRFDFAISSVKKSHDGPEDGEAIMRIAAGALVGGFAGAKLIGSAAGESCTENRSYRFTDVPGEIVMDLLGSAPQQILDWITARRKELAKENLREDQGLCTVCGEVYIRAMGGPQSQGFCSRNCKDRMETARGKTEETAPRAAVQKVTCAKCKRPCKIKLVSGVSSYKCIWCGGAIEMASEAK